MKTLLNKLFRGRPSLLVATVLVMSACGLYDDGDNRQGSDYVPGSAESFTELPVFPVTANWSTTRAVTIAVTVDEALRDDDGAMIQVSQLPTRQIVFQGYVGEANDWERLIRLPVPKHEGALTLSTIGTDWARDELLTIGDDDSIEHEVR